MHFDDANDKFKNDGAGTATIEIGANESIVEGGKFGSYLKDAIGNTRISTALGGSDFTIEYFTKCLASTTKANDLKAAQGVFAVNDEDTTETYFRAPTADRTGILVQYKLGYGLLDWTHCAFCYNHTAGEVNLYVGEYCEILGR